MAGTEIRLALYLYSGIPIVNLQGEWTMTTERVLTETISALARAGHFDIVVDLTHTTHLPLPERSWLERLEQLAASVQARCGRLDIVGTVEQMEACLRRQAKSLLRWATSEEEAICRIKGIPVMSTGSKLAMRLATDN